MVVISNEQIAAARKPGGAAGPVVTAACYRRTSGKLEVEYDNGVTLAVPVAIIQEFEFAPDASAADLAKIEIWGTGHDIYFPRLDVFVHAPALLQGIFGTKAWMREHARGMGSARSAAKAAAARENGKKGGRPRKPQVAPADKAALTGMHPRRPPASPAHAAAKGRVRVVTAARAR
ncbi:DUF2442 domain-containing protein [Paraburkholderia aspalathi]|uniref:DUF2442 domain-containing protein n=1 Tax=Paraburkholderia aspalathi TaxID=1324617 RepID=UPI0038BAC9BC